jgi:hypothetical protein
MQPQAAPQLDRLDRYVRRSYLKINSSASRYRVSHALEEGLRLASLPGEEEGRLYCFRHFSLPGIPAGANRKVWMEEIQQALSVLAAHAVHGTDPRAREAQAVYFHHEQEALETLLRSALYSQMAPEWFAASILGVPRAATSSSQVQTILERLRQPTTPAGAAAATILAAIGPSDPAPLLAAIPSFKIREWVRELENRKNVRAEAPPLKLPGQIRGMLQQAASYFGWQDPGTLWLAALAVTCLSPASLASGTAVKRARATLWSLEAAEPRYSPESQQSPDRAFSLMRHTRPLTFNDDDELEPTSRSVDSSAVSIPDVRFESEAPAKPPSEAIPESISAPLTSQLQAKPLRRLPSPGTSPALLGEPTRAAGLYFLLNALHRLRIAAVLERCPVLAEAAFVDHILKRLAAYAGVAADDPILSCLHPEQVEFTLPPDVLATLHGNPEAWPANFAAPARALFESGDLLRLWSLAVRRWCWRSGRVTVPEIVNRQGLVWLTRSDLDVTLPLNEIDIRIRRIGLDIDPGWLPWFGEFGRVVRFHYRAREPGC